VNTDDGREYDEDERHDDISSAEGTPGRSVHSGDDEREGDEHDRYAGTELADGSVQSRWEAVMTTAMVVSKTEVTVQT